MINGEKVAIDPKQLKQQFQKVVTRYSLDTGAKSDAIADFLTSSERESVTAAEFAARFGSGILTADAFEAAAIAYAKERAALPVPRHSQLSRVPKPSLLRRSPGIASTPGIPFEWHNSSGLDNKPFSRAPRLDDPLEPFVYGRKAHAARKAAAAAEKAHNSPATSKAKVAAH